jgi:hypothetical protein
MSSTSKGQLARCLMLVPISMDLCCVGPKVEMYVQFSLNRAETVADHCCCWMLESIFHISVPVARSKTRWGSLSGARLNLLFSVMSYNWCWRSCFCLASCSKIVGGGITQLILFYLYDRKHLAVKSVADQLRSWVEAYLIILHHIS